MNYLRFNKQLQFVSIFILVILSWCVLESKRTTNPYYFDEVSWICNSRVWGELIQGRWHSPIWTEDVVQRLNPQLSKYILGAWTYAKYGQTGFDVFGCPGWGSLMFISGLVALNSRQQEVLFWARIPMMLCGIISIVLIYILAVLFDKITGFFASLLTLFNPLFLVSVNRSMPDSLLLMLMLIFLLCLFRQTRQEKNIFNHFLLLTDLGLGTLLGLAVSTKTYGLILIAILLALIVLQNVSPVLKSHPHRLRTLGVSISNLFLVMVTMISVIYILNPVLGTSPTSLFTWIGDWKRFQTDLQHLPQNAAIILTSPRYRLLEIWKSFVRPGTWNTFQTTLVSILLISVGTGICIYKTITKWQKRSNSYAILLTWVILFILSMIFYVPFKFERYYLPLIPPLLILEALPFALLLRYLFQLFRINLKNQPGITYFINWFFM